MDAYTLHIIILILISGILTLSLNYVAGYAGILSVSHMTFYGIGAYTTAILMISHGLPFLAAAAAGIVLSALVAWIVSFPILKLKDDSLILVSLGFAIIAFNILMNWSDVTHGSFGISQIPAPEIFGFAFDSKASFVWLALASLIFTAFILRWITGSVYGIILKSIREEETKAKTVGYHAQAYKRSAFVVAAVFAGFAGSLFATYFSVIEPKSFDIMPSMILLIMVILGGLGNMKGAILAAIFMIMIPELLRFLGLPSSILGEVRQIIYGLFVIILMFLRPQGLLGEYKM